MATMRYHTKIDRPADEVWALVADVGGLADWFPGVETCTLHGDVRTVATMGIEVDERIVVSDPALRRLQYTIVGGPMVPEHHLATIDVLEDGDGSLLVYSCDVSPDSLADLFAPIYSSATDAIKAQVES
jgi:hypothetical protein